MRSLLRIYRDIHERDPLFFPAILLIGLALFSLQAFGGAFRAEFDAYPDESVHFVTGRMIWQYLSTLPHGNPIDWAGQYYLHYPKVGGHWPPGYHIMEALWSLIFGSSRASAMWLQWALGLAAITGLYQLTRPRFPVAVTAGIVLFAIATPDFQWCLGMTMTDIACLLFSVLFLHAVLGLLESPTAGRSVVVFLVLGAGIFVKLISACLLPVPFLALIITGRRSAWRFWAWRFWLGICAALVAILILCRVFPVGHFFAWWGGMTFSMPWTINNLGALCGWGLIVLAALGLCREPLSIVCACALVSTIVFSYFVRAMNEPRHWLIVLPEILLLSGYAITRFKVWKGALLAALGALLFPWLLSRLTPTGYSDLIHQLHLPGRILVSSSNVAETEGGFIAEVSLAERYPASLVARASKVLVDTGQSGERYHMLANDQGAILRILDEYALNVVVMDHVAATAPPHHVLLAATMASSPAWKECAHSRALTAWCRVEPPQFPRKPLTADIAGLHLTERYESH